jgi:hypothetical protein
VTELSDLISTCAREHAEGRGRQAEELWDRSARALSYSPGPR